MPTEFVKIQAFKDERNYYPTTTTLPEIYIIIIILLFFHSHGIHYDYRVKIFRLQQFIYVTSETYVDHIWGMR